MTQRTINPWAWQDNLGFSQAVEVSGAHQTLYCAGQASMSADGKPLHAGDFRAQINQAVENLEMVLKQSGYDFSNVVRLNIYATDVRAVLDNWDVVSARLEPAGCRPSSSLIGVAHLALPELMVEIEATAVK